MVTNLNNSIENNNMVKKLNLRTNDLSIISKYRGVLFGVSILSIIIFHFFNGTLKHRSHDLIYHFGFAYNDVFGSIGVEIFLFLSGLGLYYSLTKNSDIKTFYSRRFERVAIPYFIWGTLYWILADIVIKKESFTQLCSDFSFYTFWFKGKQVFWFIAYILLAYAFFPLLYKLINLKVNGREISGIICIALCAVCYIVLFWLSNAHPHFYKNTEIALGRIPVFIIGTWYGKRVYYKEKFGLPDVLLALSGFFLILARIFTKKSDYFKEIGLVVDKRVAPCYFAITLIFIFCLVFELLNSERVNKGAILVGSYSLELFMTHVCIKSLFVLCNIKTYRISVFIWYMAVSVACSYVLHIATEKIRNVLNA